MKKQLFYVIAIIALAILMFFAISNYDIDKDPSFHWCTPECITNGCPFGEE
jgi:uncharacterized protein YxeA